MEPTALRVDALYIKVTAQRTQQAMGRAAVSQHSRPGHDHGTADIDILTNSCSNDTIHQGLVDQPKVSSDQIFVT